MPRPFGCASLNNRMMKTYVITLSKTFMKGHPKEGVPTNFRQKFENALKDPNTWLWRKIHTIRGNVPLWEKRIKEVELGEACLSIREWTGRPYASKQVEIARLTKEDGVGMQIISASPIVMKDRAIGIYSDDGRTIQSIRDIAILANNDGLSLKDWLEWFKDCKADENLTVIHFTKFRY